MKKMDRLVDSMISSNMLKSPLIIDAFRTIDRKYFVPEEYEDEAYADMPLPIGDYQTISQPSTVAFMLERLDTQDGNTVLDIGSGSGWTTALLCYMVGNKGSVIGLERISTLVEQGRENLSKFGFNSHCHIEKAGDTLGLPGKQFDRILVSASADETPEELFLQLKIGGILVIPIGESIFKFIKTSETEIKKEEFYGFVFVPLIY
ncbi:protein-L-isoaspartate O-methyltransferase [Sulfurovum sp. XGS-02]|uniref:protein-L-isoaspartate O-methyltransferase family protein n=1 Tax=Sulfurovum sp. XGS-02 TaxID=2925411 RepID=UPI0020662083|nr:protein-L-isoaspartate O-methyltransferase [Sulfurovum sp. XGS-02]UPT78432.1 protein-L-isoaspartate O-methyltransferase [Sulfurovum sp. XGS-02]